ncbi:MAG: hypothetical protein IT557_09340 [Alphaproteobacteria bacterium]|nr:hypothetical protein [Alphaproteobacteria bacterium]
MAQQAWPTPARDYSVTYRMTDEEGELRVSFSAARGRVRTEMPDSYTIVDQPGRRLWMVLPEQRMAMEVPMVEGAPSAFDLSAILHGAEATRLDASTVVGHACTNYQLRFPDGSDPGTACISEEGLILRLEGKDGDKKVEIVATDLSFALQPGERFEVPAGYSIMRQPAEGSGGHGEPSGRRGTSPRR